MLVFAACVFPVHVWTIVNVLRRVPGLVLRLSTWQLVGVVSYALLVALAESLLLLAAVLTLRVILPRSVFDDRFVAHGGMIVLLSSLWVVWAHGVGFGSWGLWQFGVWGMGCLTSIAAGYRVVRGLEWLERLLRSTVEHLSTLSLVYLFADLLAVIVVIVRNVSGSP